MLIITNLIDYSMLGTLDMRIQFIDCICIPLTIFVSINVKGNPYST